MSLGSGDCIQPKYHFGNEYLSLENTLTDQQKQIFEELKKKLNGYVEKSVKDIESKFKDEVENIRVSNVEIKLKYLFLKILQGRIHSNLVNSRGKVTLRCTMEEKGERRFSMVN